MLETRTAKTQQKAHMIQSQIPENLRLRYEVLAPMAGSTDGQQNLNFFTISPFLFPLIPCEQVSSSGCN